MSRLPLDLQNAICQHAIGKYGQDPFAMTALLVNKSWAYFVCQTLYKHYRVKNYVTFTLFVKTVASFNTLLPYGTFIRSIDLTPVNKYGIDMRAHLLMQRCPYIVDMTLGHPTTLKTETIQAIVKHNTRLHTLSMGGVDSFPFMLDCDFSGLKRLRHVTLKTTPILASSFMSLPTYPLRSVCLIQMEALTPEELFQFCQTHSRIKSLTIINCRTLSTKGVGAALAKVLALQHQPTFIELSHIELIGQQITDENLKDLFYSVPKGTRLKSLRLCNTLVTRALMDPIMRKKSDNSSSDCLLQIDQLDLQDNSQL